MRGAGILLCGALASGVSLGALAQSGEAFPSRSIRLIVPNAPGGASDFVARIIQPQWAEQLGQSVVVDNRGGAAGNIALETVARATPDGYTLMIGSNTQAINPSTRAVVSRSPEDFRAFVKAETETYARVIKDAGITAD